MDDEIGSLREIAEAVKALCKKPRLLPLQHPKLIGAEAN
jgi:hypothetical protein